ncbi:MAG: ABC transporter ATP-binding protein [Planctomycetota bacterium]|jgi:putative ABC transport system ATP-binding protein
MAEPRPIVELQGVGKMYGGPEHRLSVLEDVDLRVQEGEYVAIVGPSGSGKSTLLNIMGCLDVPSGGRCLIDGVDVRGLDDLALSRLRNTRIGFVFQSFHLVSHLSVAENVELPLFYARVPRAERHRRAREMIERVGLGPRAGHLPNELSGGERQRTAIARALSNEPALILADEPTGNLDSTTSGEIMRLLHDLHETGATLVLITHDPGIARQAPRRITMSDGRMATDSGARSTPGKSQGTA